MITQLPKTLQNPNIVHIKSVTIEHSKTSCKSSKAIRQTEKISQLNGANKSCTSSTSLYSETTSESFFRNNKKKNEKCKKNQNDHILMKVMIKNYSSTGL